jgi:hypothetical protein
MQVDAFVQLALIEKSKRVFANDPDIFLSFPLLSPLTFSPQTLASLSAPASAADYAAAVDFARVVNFLPHDMVASGLGDRYLWDVYRDVLQHADHAVGSTDTVGVIGGGLLHDVGPDGKPTESAVYRAYRQYRDAWFVAREDYGTHKLSGEMTDNPDAAKHWTEVEEPALRAALAKVEDDWKTLGRRDEVEAALRAEQDAGQSDPGSRWTEWKAAFDPTIDLPTDGGGASYGPTGFSPKDFASANAPWLHFDLSAAEMASLVRDAPAALKVVLDDGSGSVIDHVSFEYRSVALLRPWFNSNVLTSRIWRSSDPDLMLSDGADPPSGACPGYVAALVFIRNLQVFSRSAPTAAPVNSDLRFTIAASRLTQRTLQSARLQAAVAPAAAPAVMPRAFLRLNAESLTVAPSLAARPQLQRMAFMPAMVAEPQIAQVAIVRDHRLPPSGMPIRPLPPAAPPAAPPSGPVATPPPPPPSPPPLDEITILAFICKRLPKVPDPLPDLRWV